MKRILRLPALVAAAALGACAGHSAVLPNGTAGSAGTSFVQPLTSCALVLQAASRRHETIALQPGAISPGMVKPAPMLMTHRLPSSAMHSPAGRHADAMGMSWTQIAGTASFVAAGPDGRFYVLSDQPAGAGPDKSIWQYIGGSNPWQNLIGAAIQIAISPATNTLYALNSGGGIYATCDGTNWTALGGGARSIGIDTNGFVYVVSDAPGADATIWEYQNGPWVQLGGSGAAVAGTWDMSGYTLPTGTISSGVYILNSAGGIYHENPNGTFASLPGSASVLAPSTNGGVFALGYPHNASGDVIYYYNLQMPGWVAENGSAISIATNGENLYAVGASGAIYQTTASGFQFGGGPSVTTLPTAGGAVPFPSSGTYGGYNGSVTWPAASNVNIAPPPNYTLTTSWATGSGDVPSSFTALPSSIGTPLLYLDFRYAPPAYPSQQYSIQFANSPAVTMTGSSALPGSQCGFALWSQVTTGWKWLGIASLGGAEVAPSGTTFTVPSATFTNPLTLIPGQDIYMALYCH